MLAVVALGLLVQPEGAGRLHALNLVVGGPEQRPAPTHQFTIAGSVTGLYPGRQTAVSLTVQNPNSRPIRVTSLTTTVGDSDKPGCGAGYVVVAPLPSPVVVPAYDTVHTSVPATMLVSAPDSCQGATWPLSYTGAASESGDATRLNAKAVILHVDSGVKTIAPTFSAVLRAQAGGQPIAGRRLFFSVNRLVVCSAVTDSSGTASCSSGIKLLAAIRQGGYRADFFGDDSYSESSATAPLVVIER